ncbi:hypothetical protein LTR36_000039 [Oleoguttula mirabilis]|uniref:Spt20-like SEP domain-containing protein n=1 Tax=Oleoguttula mirabilis TaxID=1507867 RepID=A0AAV9JXX9_9PEZI|nr:hypothetical protein LTR36_000039 [Oleoguttula mirabilis]
MATASVTRPAQALRQRDRAPRPNLSKRSTNIDGGEAPAKKRKLNEPYVRDAAYILRKHKGKAPSIVIHLHNLNFRFDGQEGSFAYDSPMKVVLEHVQKSTVPHEMLEELLAQNVPFYDGCLIVEVHNHKTKEGKEKGRREEGSGADGKFSMHQYNEHITPSPAVPYPSKARTDEQPEKGESSAGDMAAPERKGKEKEMEKDGPRIFTTVLHPTPLTQHHEMLLLATTPASELHSKKKGGDTGTPSSAQPPPTPGLSVPPTPITTTRGPLSQSQKMCLEEGDFYTFQGDVLLATEPPLFLDPVSNPQDADKVLEMLSDPLHSEKAPSPKSRKRTTAEMAADDAQAAEAERRMLIMDERIKPSARTGAGAASNENQGAAASLGFSRFKTMEMVRQKFEESERIRKDEEARAAVEKKHQDEQSAQQNALKQQQQLQEQRKREVQLAQHQQALSNRNLIQQKQEQARQQQLEQHRHAQMVRDHAHPQQNGMNNFQHPASMPQGSPVVNQQTPMMNSSPMMPNNGFPMAPTSSQGAGSPPRPTSAALQHRNANMVRHASQQGHGSQNNTPQLPQGTPSMAQVAPNRQMTPRMPPGSPAPGLQGTPTSAKLSQTQPTPHMGQPSQFTPEQMQMLRAQAANIQISAANHAGSPANVGSGGMQNMTPEQIQHIRAQQQQQQARQQQQAMLAAQIASGNPQAAQVYAQQMARARQLQQMRIQAQAQAQAQAQQMGSPAGQGMAGLQQGTPSMGHAHPSQTPQPQHQQTPQMQAAAIQQIQQNGGQQATPEQLAMAQAKGQQMAIQRQQQTQLQLVQYGHQYGGWQNIPPHIAQTLPQNVQQMLMQQQQQLRQKLARNQQQMRAQQMAAQQQQGGGGGGAGGGGGVEGQVVAGQPNPGYMQQLRTMQMQMQGQQQNGGMAGGMAGMGMGGQQPNFNGQGGGNNLDQHFANMHNALNQPPQPPQQRGPQQ